MGLFGKKKKPVERAWDDPPDVGVTTTQEIIDGTLPVVFVTRDEGVGGIGGWQFLDGRPLDERDPICIAKEELLKLDPTLAEVTDLPIGWYAEREQPGANWKRGQMQEAETTADQDSDPPLSPEADKFLGEATVEYEAKKQALEHGDWQLCSCAEWGFDMDAGVVSVRFEDGSEWQADGQLLGTFNPEDVSFQWAWDNPNITEHLTRDSRLVRALGERFGLQYLLMEGGCFPLPGPDFVAYLRAIALKATDSVGVMEADEEGMVGFIMLKNLRWTHEAA
jgi:hypothetical protein